MADQPQTAHKRKMSHSKAVVATEDARPGKRAKIARAKLPVNPAAPAPLKLKEFFSKKRADYIYANWEVVWENEDDEELANEIQFKRCDREGFGKYLQRAKKANIKGNDDIYYVEVTYKKSWHGYGRWTAVGPSQQNMHRAIRHTIAGDLYHDIDMVCSIYSHLAEYCKRMGLPFACVFRAFVDNRDRYMIEFISATGITDEEEVKKELTKIPNGGKPHEKSPEWMEAIVAAVDALVAHIKETYPQYWEIAQYMAEQKKAAGKYYNPRGSLLSLFYQVLENASWEALRECTIEQKWSNKSDGVAAYDGLQLRIGPKTPANQDDITAACRKAILDKTGHDIALKIKPMNQRIAIPDDEDLDEAVTAPLTPANLSDPNTNIKVEFSVPPLPDSAAEMFRVFAHATVADFVYKTAVNGKYVYCNNQSLWYECEANVWRPLPEAVPLHKLIRETVLNIMKERRTLLTALQEKLELVPEWRKTEAIDLIKPLQDEVDEFKKPEIDINSYNFLENTSKCIKGNALSRDFAQKLDANPNIIACTDAVCRLDTFEWEPLRPDHYVSKTTGYPKPTADPAIQTEIRDIVSSMHYTVADAEYVLNVLAFTLVGRNTAQKVYFWSGTGGNGKSLMFALFASSAGDYYVLMDIATLTKPKRSQNDHSDWDRSIGTRGCFFEEPEESDFLVLGTLKHISGDGGFVCRPAYGRKGVPFTPFFTPHIGCNGMPKLKQVDDAITRRLEMVHHPFKFKAASDPEYDPNNKTHRIRNPKLMQLFGTKKYGEQFLLILLDQLKKLDNGDIVQSAQHMEATKEYFESQDPICRFVNANYVITGHPCNKVDSKELHEKFEMHGDAHRKISPQEIRLKIEKMGKGKGSCGVVKKPSNGGYYYFGMREKSEM